jgi:hypothetical protein
VLTEQRQLVGKIYRLHDDPTVHPKSGAQRGRTR